MKFALTGTTQSDNRIQLIKAFREVTGWGLKEAKDAVVALIDSNKPQFVNCDVNEAEQLKDVGFILKNIENELKIELNDMLNMHKSNILLTEVAKLCIDRKEYGYAKAIIDILDFG